MAISSAHHSLLEDDDSYEKKYRLQHRRSFLSSLLLLLRSRRALIIPACALLFIFVVSYEAPAASISALTSIPERALDASLLRDLASPLKGYEQIKSADGKIYVVGEHHGVVSEIPEDYKWIDPFERGPFAEAMFTNGMTHNAMARMPAGSDYDMLVIGRGRSDMWYDKKEQDDFVNMTIIGFFVNYDEVAEDWIRAGPVPYVLDLPVWRQSPRPCDNVVSAGGTDPRFIWSDAGEPLAIISTTSRAPGVCQSQGMVDLRAVWPDLKKHMQEIGYDEIPIRFDTFTEIGRAGKAQKHEENWAPFFPGAQPITNKSGGGKKSKRDTDAVELTLGESTWPLFTAKLNNRTIVKVNEKLETKDRAPDSYVLSEPISLDLPKGKKGEKQEANYECLFSSSPKGWNRNEFQHATPLHRVTLCDRGSCTPSQNNTVLLSLVHYKRDRRNYRRAFITTEVDAPYRMLSVSPLMHFGTAESDESSVFSLSLSFLPANKGAIWGENPFNKTEETPGGWLNHGWLDDRLVIGTGLRDEAFDAVHLDASAALRGHTLCK